VDVMVEGAPDKTTGRPQGLSSEYVRVVLPRGHYPPSQLVKAVVVEALGERVGAVVTTV
jgi:hypothetical protein